MTRLCNAHLRNARWRVTAAALTAKKLCLSASVPPPLQRLPQYETVKEVTVNNGYVSAWVICMLVRAIQVFTRSRTELKKCVNMTRAWMLMKRTTDSHNSHVMHMQISVQYSITTSSTAALLPLLRILPESTSFEATLYSTCSCMPLSITPHSILTPYAPYNNLFHSNHSSSTAVSNVDQD
jgi:hypothetical protein